MAAGNIRNAELSYTDLATERGCKRLGMPSCEYANFSKSFNVLGILVA